MIKRLTKIVLSIAFMLIGATSFAYVDDAGIMNKFNYDNSMNMWNYLNENGFHFIKPKYDHQPGIDGYMKNDSSMLVLIINNDSYKLLQPGQLVQVVIIKPGIKTDKGIQVGSTINDVINAYGKVYDKVKVYDNRVPGIYKKEPNTGWHDSDVTVGMSAHEKSFYRLGYYDQDHHTVIFYINKKNNKVAAISYHWWGDMHDNNLISSPLYSCYRGWATFGVYSLWDYM